jgi:hypothetical protein
MAGEDFAEFAARVPSVFLFVGTCNKAKETCYPHHHPQFNIKVFNPFQSFCIADFTQVSLSGWN